MVSITGLLALISAAAAGPLVQRQMDIPEDWAWHVTGWHAGCARGGCNYNFNVTVPTVPNQVGGVKAYCSGYETGYTIGEPSTFQSCQILEGVNNGVAAKFGPRENPDQGLGPKKIFVSFTLAGYEDRPTYNFTGWNNTIYNAFVAPLQEFDVTPTEVWAIA